MHFSIIFTLLVLLLLLNLFLPSPVISSTTEQDDETRSLSPEDAKILDKFIEEVRVENLPHEYMKERLFLLRFLISADWDIADGKKKINNMLNWRQDNNIDDIINEKFEDIETEFSCTSSGTDNKGRPALLSRNQGTWPIAKALEQKKEKGATATKFSRLKRYTIQQLEIITTRIRIRKEKYGEAGPSKAVILTNMAGLTTEDTACPKCLSVFANIAEAMDKYYPYTFEKIIIVNAPKAYSKIQLILDAILDKQTNEIIQVFDNDESKWMPYVQEHFDDDQIDEVFWKKKKAKTAKPTKKSKRSTTTTTEDPLSSPARDQGLLGGLISDKDVVKAKDPNSMRPKDPNPVKPKEPTAINAQASNL